MCCVATVACGGHMVAAVGEAKVLEGGWVDPPPRRRAKDRLAGVYRRERQVTRGDNIYMCH